MDAFMMKAAVASETSAHIYQAEC